MDVASNGEHEAEGNDNEVPGNPSWETEGGTKVGKKAGASVTLVPVSGVRSVGCNARGELTVEARSCGGNPEDAACTVDELCGTIGPTEVDVTGPAVGTATWVEGVFVPSTGGPDIAFGVVKIVDRLFLVSLGISSKAWITVTNARARSDYA